MDTHPVITTLFLDIGGVLLTNGWDRHMRRLAAQKFGLDHEEMDERHHLTFDTYEVGKLTLEEYLKRVVFYRPRTFTPEDFRTFMFDQSRPYPDMLELIADLRERYRLKIAAVSNEGRDLTVHRIEKFELGCLVDFFISSCFVHYRKPDQDIYRIALDSAQVPVDRVLYVDDRALFVEVAAEVGIRGIVHTGYESTRAALESLGLSMRGEPAVHPVRPRCWR